MTVNLRGKQNGNAVLSGRMRVRNEVKYETEGEEIPRIDLIRLQQGVFYKRVPNGKLTKKFTKNLFRREADGVLGRNTR